MHISVKGKLSRGFWTHEERQAMATIESFYMGYRAMQKADDIADTLFNLISRTVEKRPYLVPTTRARRLEDAKAAINEFVTRHYGDDHPYDIHFDDEPKEPEIPSFPGDMAQWLPPPEK